MLDVGVWCSSNANGSIFMNSFNTFVYVGIFCFFGHVMGISWFFENGSMASMTTPWITIWSFYRWKIVCCVERETTELRTVGLWSRLEEGLEHNRHVLFLQSFDAIVAFDIVTK